MTLEELRAELAAILALEDQLPTNWQEVRTRCLSTIKRLNTEAEPPYPHEVVCHFLDDPDVRQKDDGYAAWQRERLRQWLVAT